MKDSYFCQLLKQEIHLTTERLVHIVERHPEIKGHLFEFEELLLKPDFILKKITGEYLLIRWYESVLNGKFFVAVVIETYNQERAWVVTSYFSRRLPKGELHG